MTAPVSAGAGVSFQVSGSASVRNNGPLDSVIADVTFTLEASADCTFANSPFTVQDRTLTEGTSVHIGRVWTVTCTEAGMHTFNLRVDAAIDAAFAAVDPDLTNNSGSFEDTTDIS